jgi:hypothetical protein
MPVVLYGCETWSLTLREEHRLKVFENRVDLVDMAQDTDQWRALVNMVLNLLVP